MTPRSRTRSRPAPRSTSALDVAFKWDTTALVPLWQGPKYRLLGQPDDSGPAAGRVESCTRT